MQGKTHELTKRREEVRQLANKVHQAKVAMDQTLWGPGGLPTDHEALGRCTAYLRSARGPNSVMLSIKEAHLLMLAYRKVRAEYMLAKAELDALSSFAAVPERVKTAREKWKKKFVGTVQQAAMTTGEFDLAKDPGLTKAISETLAETVQQMKNERSVGGIAATLESLAAAEWMGFDGVRPGECKSTLNDAKTLAEQLLKQAEMKAGPRSPVLERNILQLRSLVQYL